MINLFENLIGKLKLILFPKTQNVILSPDSVQVQGNNNNVVLDSPTPIPEIILELQGNGYTKDFYGSLQNLSGHTIVVESITIHGTT
ncbi:MAG: hypothetical protein N2558_01855, partial [Patescibacteria group bacterium]|nr:hypothetical protein [Patescibacteria group bacterium]